MIKIPIEDLKNFGRLSGVLTYRSPYWLVRKIFWKRIEKAIELTKVCQNDKIIDLGCGGGFMFPSLRHCKKIVGVDKNIDEESFNLMRKYDVKAEFIKANILKPLKLKDKFNIAFCMDVLEHFNTVHASKIINNIVKILGNNGKICISVPTDIKIYSKIADFLGIERYAIEEKRQELHDEHLLTYNQVEQLFLDLKLIGRADIPFIYPFCLYKIRVFEVKK